ncbi:N-6 DNA methylase [Streptomyces sp. LUP47B]|uniref:N-6 DNA methylase n=1 Tax=Streptomyces sp. LUP47B TaxID=1890286 RepID=UPI0009A01095|nr:N-6 DNA methylase [Streptomyces sp. LUP47B]
MNQQASALVTAADISRLAGVTRATVSNWRRRHPDFPAPAGGTDTSPTYDVNAVRAWLSARGQLPDDTPADELRTALRSHPGGGELALRLLPALLAVARLDRRKRDALAELPDDALLRWARSATADEADDIPGIDGPAYSTDMAGPLRALVRCVVVDGAEAATDVLAERLLEDTGGTGTYRTPRPLADLMARLLTDSTGGFPVSVLDPACGTGSLLTAAASAGATELRGQDILIAQAAQAAVRLRLSTSEAVISVRAGDSLRSDAFKGLTTFAVLCNPPYGVRDWGHEDLAYDQRWAYGVPPKGEPELAWVQHSLAHLAPGGRSVLLMPPAVAERTAGRRIRAQLVRDGALRAVVSLPQGAATPLHVGLHLWVLERPDPQAEPPGTVLLVDAAASKNRDLDWAAIDDTVLSAWRLYLADRDGFTGTPGIASAVPITDLLNEAVDLTPARHIRTASRQALRPALLAQQASELYDQLHQAARDLTALSAEGDWPPADDRPRDWRTATVADLLRGGALSLLRTAPAGRRTRSGELLPQPEPELGGRPTLTATDVVKHRPASGTEDLPTGAALPLIQGSDVLLTETLRVGHSPVARVVEPGETGCFLGPHLLLFRPDQRRLDPWFLAGFLAAEQNVNAAATGTSIIRVDPRRLRIPLLPLAEQQRYGAAFRHLHELRTAARRADQAAEDVTRLLSIGLTGGALLPHGHGSA